jgi:hypothetical protein
MIKNLLSIGKLADEGYLTLFGPNQCWMFAKDNPRNLLLSGLRSHGNSLYRLHTSSVRPTKIARLKPCVTLSQAVTTPAELWHNRTAHLNYQSLDNLSHRDMVTGMPALQKEKRICEPCILGKHQRTSIPKVSKTPTIRILELVHSDLCGPLPHKSMTGSRYIF